jgi:hypothetical protein
MMKTRDGAEKFEESERRVFGTERRDKRLQLQEENRLYLIAGVLLLCLVFFRHKFLTPLFLCAPRQTLFIRSFLCAIRSALHAFIP